MRLIDADALVSALNNGRLKEQTGRAVPFNAGVAFALTIVEYAPTVDAVPVVRCKDCFIYNVCKLAKYIGGDGYCSCGERREK